MRAHEYFVWNFYNYVPSISLCSTVPSSWWRSVNVYECVCVDVVSVRLECCLIRGPICTHTRTHTHVNIFVSSGNVKITQTHLQQTKKAAQQQQMMKKLCLCFCLCSASVFGVSRFSQFHFHSFASFSWRLWKATFQRKMLMLRQMFHFLFSGSIHAELHVCVCESVCVA